MSQKGLCGQKKIGQSWEVISLHRGSGWNWVKHRTWGLVVVGLCIVFRFGVLANMFDRTIVVANFSTPPIEQLTPVRCFVGPYQNTHVQGMKEFYERHAAGPHIATSCFPKGIACWHWASRWQQWATCQDDFCRMNLKIPLLEGKLENRNPKNALSLSHTLRFRFGLWCRVESAGCVGCVQCNPANKEAKHSLLHRKGLVVQQDCGPPSPGLVGKPTLKWCGSGIFIMVGALICCRLLHHTIKHAWLFQIAG